MTFRDREKKRLIPLKSQLFSAGAQQPGAYNGGQTYSFCLDDPYADENLHDSIRPAAINYFAARGIHWHDGANGLPSNHICCSQSACVNTWFPYIEQPALLKSVLCDVGYHVAEVLPFQLDDTLANGHVPYVAFEWIGERNYLGERCKARVRQRGQNSTSSDFAFRFRRVDGLIQIVLGEWKYTEYYADGKSIKVSRNQTDRLSDIYRTSLDAAHCQILWSANSISPEDLFYDPFDQLMRLQLLASEMQAAHEMGADVVSVLHIAPKKNTELMNRITSPGLSVLGESTIHDTWERIVEQGHFKGMHTEDLLSIVTKHCPDPAWADWMLLRYGW